ncbi:CocE/NonD family hydrolase [Mycobacterium sp. MYCO198283]|uniref:CocE/NonD family hydrolase n=1 Tax=Mycobacterium sp. MYCO198283 TaxID=2883505 RepID=UPI0035AB8651
MAVALGIGAAVLTGAAAAAADDGDAGASGAASTSSASTGSHQASGTATTTTGDGAEKSADDPAGAADAAATDGNHATVGGAATGAATSVPSKDAPDPKDAFDLDDDGHPAHAAAEDRKGNREKKDDTPPPGEAKSEPTSAKTPQEPAFDPRPAAGTSAAAPTSPATPPPPQVDTTSHVTEAAAPGRPQPEATAPVEKPTTQLDAAVPPASTDDPPGAPAVASLVMSLAAATRTASAEDDETYPIPPAVTVSEVVAPLQWLQDIPVAGPLVVTPVVSLLHMIPLVGEFLHPVIGWPVDHSAPPGTPQPRTVLVTSFDGTQIYAHFMPARGLGAHGTAPTVLSGPGLGLPGATTLDLQVDGLLPNDVIGVGALRDAGYNVVTWDPRGEWRSGGVMHLDSPDLEGRDVSAILTWVATLPEAQLDGRNDPRVGMVGASYGGGIQLAAAAVDPRIDAIVPTIAWNDLVDVLFPRGAVNSSWGTILPTVLKLTFAREHPRILPVAIMGVLFGVVQQSDIDLVRGLGYQDQIADIKAPTLLIQGTVDTLFTLDQADVIARQLIAAGTPTKVVWYCGGHGACLSSTNDGAVVIDRTLDWLDRYVKRNGSAVTGPQFEWVDQNGDWHSSGTYPVATDDSPVVASSGRRTTLPIVPLLGGSGPDPRILTRGPIATLLGLPSASPALNAANLHVPAATALTYVVGAPVLTLTYSGTGTAKHVYAQIVDDQTGLVLGNQATPLPVTLDGTRRTQTYSLEQVAHTLKPGQSVTVQVVTSTAKYLNGYSWGVVDVEGMAISLPTLPAGAQVPAAAA